VHGVATAVAVLAGALLPAAAVPHALPPSAPATTVARPAKAGARATLMLELHYEMQCGQPGRGTVVITLPAAAHVPRTLLQPAGVFVNGKPAPKVGLAGHVVKVTLPPPPGVTCMVIGPGTLTITLARNFGFANPDKPGRYVIGLRDGARTFAPHFSVT
jgi:hypothetical protein